jgi:hypothetical protein
MEKARFTWINARRCPRSLELYDAQVDSAAPPALADIFAFS